MILAGALSCLEESGLLEAGPPAGLPGGGGSSFSRGAAVTVRAAEALVVADQIDGAISWSLEFLCRKRFLAYAKGRDVYVCKRGWRGRTEGLWASAAVGIATHNLLLISFFEALPSHPLGAWYRSFFYFFSSCVHCLSVILSWSCNEADPHLFESFGKSYHLLTSTLYSSLSPQENGGTGRFCMNVLWG